MSEAEIEPKVFEATHLECPIGILCLDHDLSLRYIGKAAAIVDKDNRPRAVWPVYKDNPLGCAIALIEALAAHAKITDVRAFAATQQVTDETLVLYAKRFNIELIHRGDEWTGSPQWIVDGVPKTLEGSIECSGPTALTTLAAVIRVATGFQLPPQDIAIQRGWSMLDRSNWEEDPGEPGKLVLHKLANANPCSCCNRLSKTVGIAFQGNDTDGDDGNGVDVDLKLCLACAFSLTSQLAGMLNRVHAEALANDDDDDDDDNDTASKIH